MFNKFHRILTICEIYIDFFTVIIFHDNCACLTLRHFISHYDWSLIYQFTWEFLLSYSYILISSFLQDSKNIFTKLSQFMAIQTTDIFCCTSTHLGCLTNQGVLQRGGGGGAPPRTGISPPGKVSPMWSSVCCCMLLYAALHLGMLLLV